MSTVSGSAGNDTIVTGASDDSITGNGGNDAINTNSGNDTINTGGGADIVYAGSGDDSVTTGGGADTVSAQKGDDTVQGGDGNDALGGGRGNDSIDGGDGGDLIRGDAVWYVAGSFASSSGGTSTNLTITNHVEEPIKLYYIDTDGTLIYYATIAAGDTLVQPTFTTHNWLLRSEDGHNLEVIEGAANQTVEYGIEGMDDTLTGGAGDDSIYGEYGDDSISGGAGHDDLFGQSGSDTLDGGAGFDWIDGGTGDDSIRGGDDSDTVIGRSGDDTLFGDAGDDTVSGHEGDDALHGGSGSDSLYGGSGDDYFDGGDDAETDYYFMARSAGGGIDDPADSDRDVVRFEPGMGHDIAYDFEGENDYIYIGATPETDIIYTQIDSDTWRLAFNGNSNDSLTINFAPGTAPDSEGDLSEQVVTSAEYTPPANGQPAQWTPSCFTPRARVRTPQGLRPIGSLQTGDLVCTADHGDQPVRAVLRRRVSAKMMQESPSLRPVVIDAGRWGAGLPLRRMHVSRQHAFAAFGGTAFIRAIHLAEMANCARIQHNRPNSITYVHLLLDRHELIEVEGIWTESYFNASRNRDRSAILPKAAIYACIPHSQRCRPLLTRAALRRRLPGPATMGRLARQSAPNNLPAVSTASAPAGVNP